MPEYTKNFNLYKPSRNDNESVDITLSNNFQTIDDEIKKRKDEIANHLSSSTAHDSNKISYGTASVKEALDDALADSSEALTKANNSINDSSIALTNSETALTQSLVAETKSTSAVNTADNVQAQLNNIIKTGDSSLAANQAAVDAKGIAKASLKKRLDDDYNEFSSQLAETVTEITKIKEDDVITPEKFTGTHIQKIQAALDYAIENDVKLAIAKPYNITGQGTLSLNKANGSWDLDRRVLYIEGRGGSIRKDDAGYIFTAPYQNVGDINVGGLKYYSVAGAGTKVWDCDKIIRVTSMNCKYLDVDTVASAPNGYFQSMKFMKDHITGGNGWAFEFKESWDTEIDCLIEARQNGVRNTVGLAKVQNNNLTIKGVIEGLSGIAIQLGSCYGSQISCYFEKNQGGHIDLQTLDQYYQYGLLFMKNTFSMTQTQIDTNVPSIRMGKIFNGPNNAVVSIANACNGLLYNLYANESGWIVGLGDRAVTPVNGKPSRYVQLSMLKSTVSAVGADPYIQWGPMTKQSTKTVSTSFAAGETKTIDFTVDIPPLAGDPVDITLTNSINFQVQSRELITNGYRVNIKNLAATIQSTVVTMSVLKLF